MLLLHRMRAGENANPVRDVFCAELSEASSPPWTDIRTSHPQALKIPIAMLLGVATARAAIRYYGRKRERPPTPARPSR